MPYYSAILSDTSSLLNRFYKGLCGSLVMSALTKYMYLNTLNSGTSCAICEKAQSASRESLFFNSDTGWLRICVLEIGCNPSACKEWVCFNNGIIYMYIKGRYCIVQTHLVSQNNRQQIREYRVDKFLPSGMKLQA